MKNLFYSLIIASALTASLSASAESKDVTFDFSKPENLNPSIETPAVKDFVLLDGKTFTADGVSISFAATGTGNTPVRLYTPYDGDCHLRVYDGDSFSVTSLDSEYNISKIVFETAISGTTADVDLIPTCGEYVWVDNTWLSGEDKVDVVTFYSNLQSRISSLTVSLESEGSSAILQINSDTNSCQWFTLQGIAVSKPETPGIYIKKSNQAICKVVIR